MSAAVFNRKAMPKCVIYKITNIVNWKGYVGQTRNGLAARVASHKCESSKGSGHVIASAIKKYGLEKFFFRILEVCESVEQLNSKETFWIAACGTLMPRGYNVEKGGGASQSMSAETRKKMSDAKKGRPGRPLTEYHKQRLQEGRIAAGPRVMSDAEKKMRSELMKTRSASMNAAYTPEARKRDALKKVGKPVHDDAWKAKHSALMRGRVKTPEEVAKLKLAWVARKSKGWTAPKLSDETRRKLSKSGKLDWIKRKENLHVAVHT